MRFLVRLTICAIFCAMVVTQAALAGNTGAEVRVWGSEPLVEAVQAASRLARVPPFGGTAFHRKAV